MEKYTNMNNRRQKHEYASGVCCDAAVAVAAAAGCWSLVVEVVIVIVLVRWRCCSCDYVWV